MKPPGREPGFNTLLDLDGQVFVIDPNGAYWVKFVVHRVDPSPERPHGLDYSLTLHDAAGQRLAGFDNAHPIRKVSRGTRGRELARDHKHRLHAVRPYDFTDAATLLADFWTAVDNVLRERGILE
jgi:hypothetical protein